MDKLFWYFASSTLLYNRFPKLGKLSMAAYRTSPSALSNMALIAHSPGLPVLHTVQSDLHLEQSPQWEDQAEHIRHCSR